MKLYELTQALNEARRNPEMNVKTSGVQSAVNFLKQQGRNMHNYGVSMTDLPKLGINPGSRYNTPVGIYFYPAEYFVRKKDSGKKLEFKDDAPYIQVIELLGNYEYIDEMTGSVFTAYVKKLYANAAKIGSYINKSEKETTDLLSRILLDARTEAKNDSYGGWLWYILYSLGFYAGRDKRTNTPPRSSVVWNAILRLLGIDGLIDNGAGIIHANELNQGVALDPRSIRHVATFENNLPNDTGDLLGNKLNYWAHVYGGKNYVEDLAEDSEHWDLHYDVKYRKDCKVIMDRVLIDLENNPSIYNRLDRNRILDLLKLTNSNNVKQQIMVGYYVAKFPKIKADIDEMVAVWQEEKSSNDWAARSEPRKQRAYTIWVPPEKVKYLHELAKDLSLYKSDNRARSMFNYIEQSLELLK